MAKKKQKDEVKENTGKEKSKLKGILLAVLVLVVVGIGTFGGVYVFMLKNSQPEEVKIEAADYALLNDTTLNLSDESGKCYLKTSVTLSYDVSKKDVLEELEKKKISIQDATIWYLKSKKTEDFNPSNEHELKQGLIDTVNKVLQEGSILDVYLVGADGTGFVVQKV